MIDRAADGRFLGARVRSLDGSMVAVLPGGAEHPLWGASDRIVGETGLLTISAAVDWDRIGSIPPLADPTRLPPGDEAPGSSRWAGHSRTTWSSTSTASRRSAGRRPRRPARRRR